LKDALEIDLLKRKGIPQIENISSMFLFASPHMFLIYNV
jgi:hypothetical protein